MKRSVSPKKNPPKNAKTPAKATTKAPAKAVAKPAAKAAAKAVAKAPAKKIPAKKVAPKKPSPQKSSPLKAAAKAVLKTVAKAKAKAASNTKAAVKKAPPAAKTSAKKVASKVVSKLKAAIQKIAPSKTAMNKKAASKPAPVAKPVVKTRTPSKGVRPKRFPEQAAEKDFGFSADTPELPDSYGEDRLVLMTQDPEYLFTYWEITPRQLALGEQAKRADEEYREALRLNWTASDLFAPNFALLPVSLEARKGYLRVPYSGLSYQVEIGWVSDQGHFISILGRSNRSDAPESWKQTRARLKDAANERPVLEYNLSITQPLGSSELARSGRESEISPRPAGDWGFEGPGSLSSSASSGAVVRKTPRAPRAAAPSSKPRV